MKRMQVVGLCIVAAFALSAMAASSASAAPEYGQCQLLTKGSTPKIKHGKWTDPNCQIHSTKKGVPNEKGIYEWVPGPSPACFKGKKLEYTDSACASKSGKPRKGTFEREACFPNCALISAEGGAAHLEAESKLKIECATNGSEGGEVLSPTSADGKAVYTGCKIEAFGVKCKNGAPGEIKTNELLATPEEKGGKVWVNYTAKETVYLTEFDCEVVKIRVKGHAAGLASGGVNEMSTKQTQTFAKVVEGIEGQEPDFGR